MKLTRRIAIAAAAATMMLGATAAEADIKVGIDAGSYPPFALKDASGIWTGWEIEFLNDICARLNEKCQIVEVAWDGIIPALTSKQIDMIFASMAITEERKQTISFSDMYYDSASVIIGARTGDLAITPAYLAGKIIGVQVSTIHAKYAEKYFGATSTLKTYQSQDEVNADLAAGRVDYVQADGIALAAFLATDQGKACCELKGIAPPDSAILGDGVGAGLRKEDTAFRDKLNAALKSAAADGTSAKLTEKYGLTGQIILPLP